MIGRRRREARAQAARQAAVVTEVERIVAEEARRQADLERAERLAAARRAKQDRLNRALFD